MDSQILQELSAKVDELHRITKELYTKSEDFPAVNRNTKRIMAAVDMLKLNLENDSI